MTPYQEWLLIRSAHQTRTLNACLVFVPTMKTLKGITVPGNPLHAQTVYPNAPQLNTVVLSESPVKTLQSHNAIIWSDALRDDTKLFQEKLKAILGDDVPDEGHAGAVLQQFCSMNGFPFTKAGLISSLESVGIEDDKVCTASRLWGYVDGTDPAPAPRLISRPRLTQLYVVRLWIKDRLNEMSAVPPAWVISTFAKSEGAHA